jgi:two-component system, cell cycle response regulator
MSFVATILIVDDTPVGREILEDLLLSPGYQFTFASDGYEALAQAAKIIPDLILLDVMMPGMDGFETCRQLRADPILAEVPIVMVTALDDRDSKLQGIQAGADDFVSKPFDRAELRARVHTITRLNRYRRLLAERARFDWVVEHAEDGYLLVNDQDEIIHTNPKAALYLGLTGTPSESPPPPFLAQAQKQYLCEPAEAWADWPAQSAQNPAKSRYLVRPESPAAHPFWLQVTLLDQPAGLATQRLIHLRDVTMQMSLQRDMYTFHSALSHKLRTPLTHLATSLEFLVAEGPDLPNEQMVHLSKIALKGARRLRAEIEDILQYINISKLNQAEVGTTLSEFQQLVTEISGELEIPYVSVDYQEGIQELKLSLSQRAVEWIIREILENAKKFHPQQSPRIEITLTRPGENMLHLKIADDGLTLAPDQLTQIWMPYYQGEKYFTGETAGMGLGLSIVASLLREGGGTCQLYNRTEGSGMIMELKIPTRSI